MCKTRKDGVLAALFLRDILTLFMEEIDWKAFLKKWWLHIILMGTQFIFGVIVNYALYKFLNSPPDQGCGMPMVGSVVAQIFFFFMALIPLLIRMEFAKGFSSKEKRRTLLLLSVPMAMMFLMFFL